jgi:hypothetical protein
MHHKRLMMRAKSDQNSKFVSARRRNQHARRVRSPDPRPSHSISGYGPLPPSSMKRSIRAVTTGSGTEPSSSTASGVRRAAQLQRAFTRCIQTTAVANDAS